MIDLNNDWERHTDEDSRQFWRLKMDGPLTVELHETPNDYSAFITVRGKPIHKAMLPKTAKSSLHGARQWALLWASNQLRELHDTLIDIRNRDDR